MKAAIELGVSSGSGTFYSKISGSGQVLSSGQSQTVEMYDDPVVMNPTAPTFVELAEAAIIDAANATGIGNADKGMSRVDGNVYIKNVGDISVKVRTYKDVEFGGSDDYSDTNVAPGSKVSANVAHSNKQTLVLMRP